MATATRRPGADRRRSHDQLADAVLTASRVLVAVAARSLAEHESEVSLPQYRALVVLGVPGCRSDPSIWPRPSVSIRRPPPACAIVWLRKRLITRRRDVVDRRVVLLDLSASGRRLVDRVTQRRRQEIGRILEAVDPAEHGALVRAFTTFGAAAGEVPEDDWQRSWEL